MLTETEVNVYLAELTYWPGWSFEYYHGRWEGPHLAIRATVSDAYHPGQTVELDIHSPVPPHALRSREDLDEYLCWRLARIASHEVREGLRRNGKPIFDPHADGADRDR